MNILILGGTVFLGRAIVEDAVKRGHRVTLFNRGRTAPALFPDVETIIGDRTEDLSALAGRRWDAAIDTCGYVPRVVAMSARALANAVEHYTFISSISVYADFSIRGMDESAAVGTLEDETIEEVTGDTYGRLKALCEVAAERAIPGRVLVVRPGLIVGPHDPTNRFTYWPHRVGRGGQVLSPGDPNSRIQLIDVRDLAAWIVTMVEQKQTGTYHTTGPRDRLLMGEFLHACRAISGSDATLSGVDEDFLIAQGVGPWSDLPMWLPNKPEYAGFQTVDCRKAIDTGLTFRPLAHTVADTLAWATTRPEDHDWEAGLTPDREAAILAAWEATQESDSD
jgi:2'-hydroxyisoflavone reductase